ncbi:hypothetical protein [Plantactinospora sp. CA-290183]|uniref:hypothetical protein n=1 Tax=Plantactinospora sp. CA-290183 TaxID=3240006 RepID=UPI003D93EC65
MHTRLASPRRVERLVGERTYPAHPWQISAQISATQTDFTRSSTDGNDRAPGLPGHRSNPKLTNRESLDLDAFHNREILKTTGQSGHTYVATVIRQPEDKGEGDSKLQKVAIASTKLCGHINRICAICAPSWEQDWVILYDRTEGGRLLKSRL